MRDRRGDRDRYYDERDYNDRDRKRSRRDDGSARRSHRAESRDRRSNRSSSVRRNQVRSLLRLSRDQTVLTGQSPRPSTADAAAEEAQKAARARTQAWAAKKLAARLQQEASASGASSPQTAIEQPERATASPAFGAPAENSGPTTARVSPAVRAENSEIPAPYAGKFDPKLIAQRAAARMQTQKAALAGDVAIPKSANAASNVNDTRAADNSKVVPSSGVSSKSSASPREVRYYLLTLSQGTTQAVNGDAKITGFGLNKAEAERSDKATTAKPAANLDEEEKVERKLEKLPTLSAVTNAGDAALADGADDQDEADDIGSDGEDAQAARDIALRRAQEAQAEVQDVVMASGEETAASAGKPEPTAGAGAVAADVDTKMADEDDIDPLDAFMDTLEQPKVNDRPNLAIGKTKKKQPQVFNSDDEDELEAVGEDTDDILAIAAKRKKKEIPTVDHSKMQYDPFRKNFYSESVELSDMSAEDVEILRAELENTKVRGVDPPKPLMKFSQGGFGAQILDVIRGMGYEKPSAIQSSALPAIMSGRDMIGVAKTGSGKTVAFILPMFRHIKDQRPLENLDGPIGLVLAPTRELATQIHRDCKPYLKALNLRAVCAYGGAPIKDQIADLKRGAEIVVCTPGRMIDLLAANSGRVTNLRRITYIVLDEADRMFDMGFEPQITKILNNVRPDRQTVLFSATFPRNMEALARKALKKPLEVVVGGRSVVAPEITQVIEVRHEETKFGRLLELLGELHDKDEDARSLVFVEKQESADNIFTELGKKGYPSVSIHGGREQIDRDQAISDFRAGIYPVMIATSVAARGLDVKQLKLVVNYDSPNHVEDYVHRAGRTGRAGNTGTAVTFITPEQDRYAKFMIKALTDSKQQVPEGLRKLREAFDAKLKAGDAKKASSGFGGRGIERLDAERDAERARERDQYPTGDEPEEDKDGKKTTDAKQKEVDQLLAKATGVVKDRDADSDEQPDAGGLIPSALNDHLENAMRVEKIQKAVTLPTSSRPASRPAPRPAANDPLAKVNVAVANINSRLGAKGELYLSQGLARQRLLTLTSRFTPPRCTHRQPRPRCRRFPRHPRDQRLSTKGPLGRH